MDQSVQAGQSAMFSVGATGTGLHYEWRRNGVVISGAPDAPDYVTPPTTPSNDGEAYSCRVFNFVGILLTVQAVLHVS